LNGALCLSYSFRLTALFIFPVRSAGFRNFAGQKLLILPFDNIPAIKKLSVNIQTKYTFGALLKKPRNQSEK
jgi:hypothetical protein